MKRELALEYIRIDAAKHGKSTSDGIRVWMNHPTIGRAAYLKAVREGIARRKRFAEWTGREP